MATPKTWTATDISKTGTISIQQFDGGQVRFFQHYEFLDENGDPLPITEGDNLTEVTVAWADIPADVQAALLGIRDYMYQVGLQKNEMTD